MKKFLIAAAILSFNFQAASAQGLAGSDFQYISGGVSLTKIDTYQFDGAGGLASKIAPIPKPNQSSASPTVTAGLGWSHGWGEVVAEVGLTKIGSTMVVKPEAGFVVDTSKNTSVLPHAGYSSPTGLTAGIDLLYHITPSLALRAGTTLFQKRVDGAKGQVELSVLHPF